MLSSPSCLPNLLTLSLYGNPVISTINYISFLKMLIPTLTYIDDRRIDEDLKDQSYRNNNSKIRINKNMNLSGVCPQE